MTIPTPSKIKPRVLIVIQARMGSTRLPGKHLKIILNRPLVSFLIERLRAVQLADALVMATTTNTLDNALVEFCKTEDVPYFRGSEEDVLDRFYQCAKKYQADVVVRVTADCPLIDPAIIDQTIQRFLEKFPHLDFVTNVAKRSYPRGMDVEVFSFKSLEKVAQAAKQPAEREHVTPYYYRHPELFKTDSVFQEKDDSHFRLTVDTTEDLDLISLVLKTIYPKKPSFTLSDLLELFHKHPDWMEINAQVKQKELGS
jgi:spore coat polysaccharide biosynthesis protein SpsF